VSGQRGDGQDKLLLTPEEAAEVLGIGRTKVYALISDGDLLSVRIGNSRRVPRDAVDEFIARLEDEARLELHERMPRLVAR
jgi:excisionase family DNA binding protein